ncbi:MAG TPA: hypothetical protein VKR79_05000 [Gaiellaceae bacterium]|nr:hypothetical protein [Gaiellaceae bacterium]
MRLKISTLAIATAAVLATASIAFAGMMHPTLGARLSGMGDHGIVNLQSHASKGQLCWKFELSVMHLTSATVRDAGGMIVAKLGHMYSAKGCGMVAKHVLDMIEEKPGSYWVWVATAGHPGDLRGKLFAGMAHM